MKITIELEIQPDEVGLATELLSTLRTLTDHVKVVTPGASALSATSSSASGPPPGAVPQSVSHSAAVAPPPAPSSTLPNGNVLYQPANRAGAPPPALVPPPPLPPPQQQQQPAQPAAPAAPAIPPAAPHQPTHKPGQPLPAPNFAPPGIPQPPQGQPRTFALILPHLANPSAQEQAVADVIETLRGANEANNLDKAAEDLVAAFEQCVFDNPEVIGSSAGVMPYMSLYPRLPDVTRFKVREKMVAKVLGMLTKKRPVNADRASFFAYADAFAALVKFEAVPLDGAVQTIIRLLGKPETKCAGITILAKTVEYCGQQLLRAPETHLASLWRSLESVKEDVFQYDLEYILGTLHALMPPGSQLQGGDPAGGTAAAAAAATAAAAAAAAAAPAAAAAAAPKQPAASSAAAAPPPPAAPSAMTHLGCYQGHGATVFTLCYDATHGQLSSGGQDGQLLVWGHDGTPVSRMDVSSHFVCSLDVLPRSGTLLAAAVSNPEGPHAGTEPPCVLGFAPPPGGSPGVPRVGAWSPRGRLYGMNRGIISFVRALGGDGEIFALGENCEPAAASRDVVCLYDASRGGPLEQLTPLVVYNEHSDMVTCGVPWGANPYVFVSGGRDASIRVWDRRMQQSVGSFGETSTAPGQVKAHNDMVTCLDTTDNLLLSSSVDGFLCIWDFRQLNMTHGSVAGPVVKLQIDTQPMLKVAVTGAPHSRLAAISTYQGLYVMDFTNMTAPSTVMAPPFPDGRPFKYYHDIRWAGGPGVSGQAVLFGASDDPRIDVFGLAF